MIEVEVVYATPEKQTLLTVRVAEKSTVAHTILESGMLAQFPKLNLDTLKVGIFSTICALEREVKTGDRIEIYRSLQNDPKDARRQRAMKK